MISDQQSLIRDPGILRSKAVVTLEARHCAAVGSRTQPANIGVRGRV